MRARKFQNGIQRVKAKTLRSILDGVFDRMEAMAKKKFSGMAQLLYTEISGHGGLQIFRRIDAATRASEKGERKDSDSQRKSSYDSPRNPRFRGLGRGGARSGKNVDITCYGCFRKGHTRANCPDAGNERGGDAGNV